MIRIRLVVVFACLASAAPAQCRPEGRSTFAAGLRALADGDLPAAAAQFNALVRVQPDCVEARNNLAAIEAQQGRLAEAAEQLRQVIQLRPDYQRARANLHRVGALVPKVPVPSPTTAEPTPTATKPLPVAAEATATPEPAATAAAETPTRAAAPVAGARAPEAGATLQSQPVPSGIAALEPLGVTACAIDTARQQVCVYTRVAEAIVPRGCYPIAASRLGSLPRWAIAGNGEAAPLRLIDESGRLRLTVAPEGTVVKGDVVWLRQADFDSLLAKVIPGRTGFVVMDKTDRVADPTVSVGVQKALQRWRWVWEHKRFAEYVSEYSQSFVPPSPLDLDQWRAQKRQLFERPGNISVQVTALTIFVVDGGATAITVFERWYRSPTSVAHDLKAMRWQREGDAWKISAETVLQRNLGDRMPARLDPADQQKIRRPAT
jgi:hypothetical protein